MEHTNAGVYIHTCLTVSEHYAQLGKYKLVESCILQLNPKCLDIHQVNILSLSYTINIKSFESNLTYAFFFLIVT